MHFQVRNMRQEDAEAVVSLNAEVVAVTSPMDKDCLTNLYELSTIKLVAEIDGLVVAFILAMSDGRSYDNANYRWFSERLERFLYIDRVVVSRACKGLGIGRQFYSRVFDLAEQSGALGVCAEMDLEPPNQASLGFHRAKGFVQIGTRRLDSGKQISMQVCTKIVSSAGV